MVSKWSSSSRIQKHSFHGDIGGAYAVSDMSAILNQS
jgi:hypothetical protein